LSFDFGKILEYLLEPKKSGYDAPKTITYGLILVLAVYAIYKILKKIKVKIDRKLAVAVAPYVVLGSSLRVLEDMGLTSGYFFVTPGIYFLVFLIVIATLLSALVLQRKKGVPYFKSVFIVGMLLMSVPLARIVVASQNIYGVLLVMASFLPWVIIFKLAKWSVENKAATLLQLFDATVTFVSLQFFSFYEQHILPTALIDVFGPASFIIFKAVGIVALMLVIDRFSDDREFNTYIKLVIGILGAATGTRDLLALAALG
jgi:uncharacterized membrane protein